MNPLLKLFLIFGTLTSGGLIVYAFIFPIERGPIVLGTLVLFGYASIGLPTLLAYHWEKKDQRLKA